MIKLSTENFNEEVISSRQPVVVNYWSGDCDRCKELISNLEEISDRYEDMARFATFNISGELTYDTQNSRLALNQGVRKLPTVVIYLYGEKKVQLEGQDLEVEDIESALEKYL